MSLHGKKGLIVGIANENSIAYGCAEGASRRRCGARRYLSECESRSLTCARLPKQLESPIIVPCDVREPGQLEAVFSRIREEWGRLDFLLHSIAYAPKEDLHSRITDCSQAGFALAMDVSCHSFIRMARLAEPLMTDGGCLFTVTFYGSEKVVEDYNLMGPVKAALESCVRYMAAELGPKRIRVHALSPGPLKTRAASGIERLRRASGAGARPHARASAREHRGRGQPCVLPGQRRRGRAHREHRICRRRLSHRRLTSEFGVAEWNASKTRRSTR